MTLGAWNTYGLSIVNLAYEMEGVNIMTLGAWTLGKVLTNNSKC